MKPKTLEIFKDFAFFIYLVFPFFALFHFFVAVRSAEVTSTKSVADLQMCEWFFLFVLTRVMFLSF